MALGPRRVIALWSAPRSRSTAFFRTMLERDDVLAVHEPFCEVADHGETEVGDRIVHTARDVIAAVRDPSHPRPVFLKETTDREHPAVLADGGFLAVTAHLFLIRHPAEIVASYYALRPEMACSEVGLAHLHRLRAAVRAAGGQATVVDSEDLVSDPHRTVEACCDVLGLPFVADALRWDAGERPEWRLSARWHVDVARSTGIERRDRRYAHTVDDDAALRAMAEHHEPFYEELRAERLVVG